MDICMIASQFFIILNDILKILMRILIIFYLDFDSYLIFTFLFAFWVAVKSPS